MKSASMLRRHSAFCIVHFAVLCAAGASQLAAGNARFTLLAPRMVRCEWSADGVFEDSPSLVFVNRDKPSVPFERSLAGDAAGIHRASAQGCRKVMEC